MRSLKTSLLAAVAMTCLGGVAQAQVLVPIYGGGATFPSKTLRLLGDCYGVQLNAGAGSNGTADVAAAALAYDANCNGGGGFGALGIAAADDPTRIEVFLYAPVGSGGGKNAFRTHTMVGAPATSNKIGFTDNRDPSLEFGVGGNPGYPLGPQPGTLTAPRMHFIGSDDVVNSNDYNVGAASYVGSGNKAKYGEWIGIPELAGPVTIDFAGTDGAGNALPLPHDSNGKPILNLSRKSFCGIFSGHITKWGNASLLADNPALAGVPAGVAQNITVVHRSDGSGTTFLFTNALVAQCASETGGHAPFGVDDGTGALATFNFPWKDQNASFNTVGDPNYSCNTPAPVIGAPANALPVEGANLIGWPDFASTAPVFPAGNDICGTAIPAGSGHFVNASGSGGVTALVTTTAGGIGYVSPDFVYPIVPTGNPVANLQNEYNLSLGVAAYVAPSAASATIALAAAIPPSSTDANFTNPLLWAAAEQVPNPAVAGAYPISGFTNFGFYQCYQSSDTLNVIFDYLKFHYGVAHGGVASSIMNGQGFAPVPGTTSSGWLGAIATLVTAAAPLQIGPAAGVCSVGD